MCTLSGLRNVCSTDASQTVITRMRELAASRGCTAVRWEVADMLAGLRVLPAGADAALTLSGIANLMQASSCTTAANGGPMMNACTGSAGCGAAAASA